MKNRYEEGMSDYEIQRRDKDRGHGGMLLLCDGSTQPSPRMSVSLRHAALVHLRRRRKLLPRHRHRQSLTPRIPDLLSIPRTAIMTTILLRIPLPLTALRIPPLRILPRTRQTLPSLRIRLTTALLPVTMPTRTVIPVIMILPIRSHIRQKILLMARRIPILLEMLPVILRSIMIPVVRIPILSFLMKIWSRKKLTIKISTDLRNGRYDLYNEKHICHFFILLNFLDQTPHFHCQTVPSRHFHIPRISRSF